ncbi:MAG: CDP-diacylglycerol--serine O-phosphatidyltransferase [Saprospiraceae bacterium]|jgi:CDP-diacylglycerol--serine O-phosphatidyltransferase
MNIKTYIPNTITSLNLVCGCRASIAFLEGDNELGIALVIAAFIFDFLDGFVARMLKVQSEIGKQLDSLADMVTFGVVPGIVLYVTLLKTTNFEIEIFNQTLDPIPYFGFVITVFSALRLAKFNLDTRQSESFIGLPTPANTILFLTIPLSLIYAEENSVVLYLIRNTYVLLTAIIVFSYLLIAEIPLLSLKFKSFSWKDNKEKYVLLISSVTLLWAFSFLAPVFIIVLYLIISIIHNVSKSNQ